MSHGSGGHRRISSPVLRIAIEDLDPSTLEPGQIVADRYVLYDTPTTGEQTWHAPAVDSHQKLGAPPHHRVRLEFIPCTPDNKPTLLRALEVEHPLIDPAWAILETPTGLLIATRPPPDGHAAPGLDRSTAYARLGDCVRNYHRLGIAGIRIDPHALRNRVGTIAVVGFSHLFHVQQVSREGRAADEASLRETSREWVAQAEDLNSRHPQWDAGNRCEVPTTADGQPELPLEPPFTARNEELTQLFEALSESARGRATAITLCGEGGIGKSRLLREFTGRATSTNRARPLVLRSISTPGSSTIAEALASLARRLPDMADGGQRIAARVTRRIGPLTSVLVRLTPELASVFGTTAEPPPAVIDDEYMRHVHVVADALRSLGTEQCPLLLAIDEADALDAGSKAVIQDLLQDPQHHTMIVLAGRKQRPAGLDVRSIRLHPLNKGQLALFIRRALGRTSPRLHDLLYRHVRATPWTTWSTLQAWKQSMQYRLGEQGWDLAERVSPPAVESLVSHRLQRLSPAARHVLLMASLRGGQTEADWIHQVSDLSAEETAAALLELSNSRLLLPQGEFYRVAHDFVRATVIEEFDDGDIRQGHARIAAWLRSQPGGVSLSQLAVHEERATTVPDERLSQLHLEAGIELLRLFDLEQAHYHFERVCRPCSNDRQRIAALEGLADTDVLSDRVAIAAKRYASVVKEHPDTVRAIEIATKATHALYAKSAPKLALQVGRLALRRVRQPTGSSKLQLICRLPLEMALSESVPPGIPEPVRDALCRLHPFLISASLAADPLSVVFYVYRARRLAHGLQSAHAALTLTFYGALFGNLREYEKCRQILNEAEHLVRASDDAWVLGVIHHVRAHVLELPSGAYAIGQQSLDEAIACFRQSGNLSLAPLSLFFKAAYGRNREPTDKLIAWLDDAELIARRHGNKMALPSIAALRLHVASAGGRLIDDQELEALSAQCMSLDLVPHDKLLTHAFLALAWLEVGNPQRAKVELERSRRLRPRLPGMPEICEEWHVAAARCLAECGRGPREWLDYHASMKRLLRIGRDSPRLWAAAVYARHISALRRGSVARARAELERLLDVLDRHGEQALCDRAVALSNKSLPQSLNDAGGSPVGPSEPRVEHGSPQTSPSVSVSEVLDAVRPMVPVILPGTELVVVDTEDELHIPLEFESAQTLIVQLICAVRDATPTLERILIRGHACVVTEREAAKSSFGRAGEHVAIRVEGTPTPTAPFMAGLRGCQRILRRVDGFLDDRQRSGTGSALIVYLPPANPSRPSPVGDRPAVFHADPRIRSTLMHALTELGHEPLVPETLDGLASHRGPVFVDPPSRDKLQHREHDPARLVTVVARRERALFQGATLSFPFTTSELLETLERVPTTGRDRLTV